MKDLVVSWLHEGMVPLVVLSLAMVILIVIRLLQFIADFAAAHGTLLTMPSRAVDALSEIKLGSGSVCWHCRA